MLSQRRSAQMGLVAAGIILIASVFCLVAGSADLHQASGSQSVSPLADTQLTDLHLNVVKR